MSVIAMLAVGELFSLVLLFLKGQVALFNEALNSQEGEQLIA